MTCLTEEMTVITTAKILMLKTNNNNNNNNKFCAWYVLIVKENHIKRENKVY